MFRLLGIGEIFRNSVCLFSNWCQDLFKLKTSIDVLSFYLILFLHKRKNLTVIDFLHMTKKILAWKLGDIMSDIYVKYASIPERLKAFLAFHLQSR